MRCSRYVRARAQLEAGILEYERSCHRTWADDISPQHLVGGGVGRALAVSVCGQSTRNAWSGLMRLARTAGTVAPASATAPRATAATRIVTGSSGSMPNSWLRTHRPNAHN